MSGKNTYWITTTNGYYGQVEGVDERDRWTPRGWSATGEPGPTDFVWMWKDDLEQPAPFAYGAAPMWQQKGWQLGPPPEPVDVTKDPQLFEQDDDAPKLARRAKRGEKNDTTSEPAAGADENTKE